MIAAAAGITTVSEFRTKDVALGGQGLRQLPSRLLALAQRFADVLYGTDHSDRHAVGVALDLGAGVHRPLLAAIAANDAMLQLGRLKPELPALPARASYRMTVADMNPASGPDAHAATVRRWARSTWEDWSDQHAFVAEYLARSGLGPFSSTVP